MIITILFIIYILSYVYGKVFKVRYDTLNCGLFGFCGSSAPDMTKIKVLGILNESRGTHSCGIYYNNEVKKGVDKESIFTNFLVHNLVEPVEGAHVFIGHTRSATYGTHSLDNAHPFLINDRFVLAHNGTISNIWTLCNNHGVVHTNIHVDSLGLACILDKDGPKVLDEYEGHAALLMHKLNEPESLYVYHGASARKPDGEEEEERPLYFLKVSNGYYFSSLAYALEVIKENNKQVVGTIHHNRILKFTNGKLEKKFTAVDRNDRNVDYPKPVVVKEIKYVKPSDNNGQGTATYNFHKDSAVKSEDISPTIWRENPPIKSNDMVNNLIYWHMGRYWEVKNTTEAQTVCLASGKLQIVKRSGFVHESGIPLYFYQGILMKNAHSYELIKNDVAIQEKLKTLNFAAVASKYAKYPVCNLEGDADWVPLPAVKYAWFRDGRPEKSSFTPMFSDRTYAFKAGLLTKISCTNKAEEPLIRPSSKEIVENLISSIEEEDKTKQMVIFPTKEQEEAEEKEVDKEMIFFTRKDWENDNDIHKQLTQVGKTALYEFMKDAAWSTMNKPLTPKDFKEKLDDHFASAVLDRISIEDCLEKIGSLREYVKTSVQFKNDLKSTGEHIIHNNSPKKQAISDDYVKNAQGVFVPKDDYLPFEPDLKKPICSSCKGLGRLGEYKCLLCEGSGLDLKEQSLFSDIPLKGEKFLTEVEAGIEYENVNAADLLDEFVDNVRNTEVIIDSLGELTSSELAKDSLTILNHSLNDLKKNLTSVASRFGLDGFVSQLNKKSLIC